MDLSTLIPLSVHIPPLTDPRSQDYDAKMGSAGAGVAACQDMLVISSFNKLQVFALPEDIARGAPRVLVHMHTLGGVAPMEFEFGCFYYDGQTGHMAFTDGRLLLVTDAGQGAVHVIDVVHGAHVGYVAAPGSLSGARGVATRKSLAAISSWEEYHSSVNHSVHVFERDSDSGSGACAWTAVRVIRGQIDAPSGLRFSADGVRLAVADARNKRLSFFCAKDGSFCGHVTIGTWYPCDVEEWQGGWIVGLGSEGLVAVADNGAASGRSMVARTLALVPGVGLVVRHDTGVQFLATPDAVAMAAMSSCKVAWMAAVCRGMFSRVGFFLSHN